MDEQHGLKLIGAAVLVPVIVAVILTLFAWPAANLKPRELPIGLVAPGPAGAPVKAQLEKVDNGGEKPFDIHSYDNDEAARSAIKDREVYGAIVIGAQGATVLTASGASPTVAQLLTQGVTELAKANGQPAPKVVDVAPGDPDDPRGAVLGSAVLPLVLAGMLLGILLTFVARPGFGQVLALIAGSALAGLVAVGIAQGWLGAFGGHWYANAGGLALTILAIGSGIAGLGAVLGRAGVGLGAAVMMLLGNPLSGITSAPEMLPTLAGKLGQFLPPGAGGQLLRDTAFFDGAAVAKPLAVLTIWAGAGLLLVLLGAVLPRNRK